MRKAVLACVGFGYRHIVKPLLFLQNPEAVHARATALGQALGRSSLAQRVFPPVFRGHAPALMQNLFGLDFRSPIGLAAGFDYEGRLTEALPMLGFGFGTVGTLTNLPYEGNPGPRLGRLPKSKSLLVNKGFKNLGVAATLHSLPPPPPGYLVGVSIGKTNTASITTQAEGVRDVVQGFTAAEASGAAYAYYELNISCPNLQGSVEFYAPPHLEELLGALSALALKKPVWIKMPISKTDAEIRAMLEVVTRYPFVQAVIFGNLQRDRADASFDAAEVQSAGKGNFSGLPCRTRSDELIALAFREYGDKLRIIGCGGVFSAADAYRKITLGASLVQLITGLVYEGPQLAAQINDELPELMARDGFATMAEAIGSKGA